MAENTQEMRSLALTPTWSVATVLTIFVAVSLLVERSIHRLSHVSSIPKSPWLLKKHDQFNSVLQCTYVCLYVLSAIWDSCSCIG
jgi:hypothetical protein